MDGLKKQIEEVRDVLGRDNLNSINSEEQLDQKMRELEMRLIRESLGVVEEKRIAGELNSLKTKKSKMGDLKESLRNLRRLETRMKECRAEVGLANKEIRERQGKMGELKEELDRLNESNRNKHPEIEALNSKIAQLKEQKKVQLELREERRGVVHAMEVEYKKHEQDLLVAKEQEEKKEQLRKEIGARRKQVAEIRLKMGQFGKEVFERLIVAVEQVRRSGNYFLSADLVGELVRHGIALPSNEATAKKTLEELKNGRDNADETFASKRGVLQNEIDVIEKEVAEMQKMLAEMPESNVELLKKYKGDRKQY
ncbi:hypothetical protein ECANGB1_2122 [Enterospora canceri]|uniref:Uncharacterized protein n=1 Tax=Enterospora canceri TaxID=1081671 RepID=A0A1Y1S5Q5_9MICR|nr:hypothetical protein ECANGB1_2122 [Enterospora canceri]